MEIKSDSIKSFALSDRVLPLHVCVHKRARRLTLRVEAGGQALRVSVPPHTPEAQIFTFLERFRGWLELRVAKLPKPRPDGEPMLRPGVKIPYLGRPHIIMHHQGRGVTRIEPLPRFSDNNHDTLAQIILYGDLVHLPRHLRDFLQRQAEKTLSPLVVTFAKEIGRKPRSIRYKDTKSRWGSCNTQGDLSFSWRIIMAPPNIIRYLVAHEVSHLVEMNHGVKFWRLCEKLCPDSQHCRNWLKRNGQALHAIDFG